VIRKDNSKSVDAKCARAKDKFAKEAKAKTVYTTVEYCANPLIPTMKLPA